MYDIGRLCQQIRTGGFGMEIGALLRFLAVCEAGSFAAAARQLGVSRQAVHRSIDSLERVAGAPLFDRTTRELRITALGRGLLEHAKRARSLQQEVRATIDRAREVPSGLIRVTAPPVFGETVLPSALTRLAQKWPDVRVMALSESHRTSLLTGDYDLMIRVGAEPPEQHYAVPLGFAETLLCVSASYLEQHEPVMLPVDVAQHDVIEYGARASAQWHFQRSGVEEVVDVSPRIISEVARVVVDACLNGVGILLAPRLAVSRELKAGHLVQLLTDWQLPRPQVWCVYGHRTHDDPSLAVLLTELKSAWKIHTEEEPSLR